MMIRINLLPIKIRAKKETGTKQTLAFLGCVLLTLLIVALSWLYQESQLNILRPKAQNLKSQLARYRRVEVRIKNLKKDRKLIDQRIKIIKNLQKDRDSLLRILALLTETIPKEKIWFKKLNEKGRSIRIEGTALSNEDISNFMRNLANSMYIGVGHVNLIKSQQKEISGRKLRSFELRFQYRTPSQIKQLLASKEKQK